jgi:DNA-directed RNA polymerase specialized sigma24 family protein
MINSKEPTSEEAVRWVQEHAKVIQGHVRKYLPFAPYDQDDYLQDAYEAALTAVQIAKDRQIPFAACFWIVFRRRITAVTPHPESRHRGGSKSPPMTICDFDSDKNWDFADKENGANSRIDIDRLYLTVRDYLTEVERKVLSRALGIHGGRQAIKEIARNLGCSPANVRQSLNRAYDRLARLVAARELDIRREDIEPRRLAVISGCSKAIPKHSTKLKFEEIYDYQIA